MTDSPSCSERQHVARRIASCDGRLTFDLRRVAGGILVVRRHAEHLRDVEHAMVFPQRDLFHRYLDVDPLRFRYVLQYVELKRAFDELLASEG
jgi:hypothetical protein